MEHSLVEWVSVLGLLTEPLNLDTRTFVKLWDDPEGEYWTSLCKSTPATRRARPAVGSAKLGQEPKGAGGGANAGRPAWAHVLAWPRQGT